MPYSDVASLIDQYSTITPDHAEAIAAALARQGFLVKLEWNRGIWGTETNGVEVRPHGYRSPDSGSYRVVELEELRARH